MLAPGRHCSLTIVDIHAASLRQLHPFLINDSKPFQTWLTNPAALYIGRQDNHVMAAKSIWANPFSVKEYGLDECLRRYEQHVRDSGLYWRLQELANRDLGCWCYNNSWPDGSGPYKCHGDILVKLYRERFG